MVKIVIGIVSGGIFAGGLGSLAWLEYQPAGEEPLPVIDSAVIADLTPEVLAVAGLSGVEAEAALSDLGDAVQAREDAAAAQLQLDAAATDLTAAREAALEAIGDAEAAAAVVAAESALDAAQASFEQAQEAVLDAMLDGLAPADVTAVQLARAAVGRKVPPEYAAVERTPEEWDEIEVALIAKSRAERRGEAVPEDVATLIADIEGDAAVVAGRQAISTNLDDVKEAYADADNPE